MKLIDDSELAHLKVNEAIHLPPPAIVTESNKETKGNFSFFKGSLFYLTLINNAEKIFIVYKTFYFYNNFQIQI